MAAEGSEVAADQDQAVHGGGSVGRLADRCLRLHRGPVGAQLALDGALVPPRSLSGLRDAVWGIDPSSLRVSVAAVIPGEYSSGPAVEVATKSLPKSNMGISRWYAESYAVLLPWLAELAERWPPVLVLLEEPFSHGKTKVHPTSNRMLGVLLAALGCALGSQVELVELIGPQSWKARGLGAGHGHAQKPEILEWARRAAGYEGDLQDEADAIGIATAAAVQWDAFRRGAVA